MDRLEALRIKYARAQEHRAAWARALDKWVATMPYGVRGKADQSGWFVTRLVARELPPPELSVIFADLISNLRATLDHIIWALVEESGNATHDQLTFPCVLDRKDWSSSLRSRLMNVPPQWIPAIERAQPFTVPHPRLHPMYVLHRLDITTKHRLLIPIEPSTFEWEATYSVNRAIREDDHRINRVAPTGVRLTDGVELARVRFFSKTADLEVTGIEKVTEAAAGWGPGLDELDLTGDDPFPDMMTFVETQIETFAPAFPPCTVPAPALILSPGGITRGEDTMELKQTALTATLTATRSTITPSTKIITHDHPPDRDHGGPSRTLLLDLRIRGQDHKPGAILGARSYGRSRPTTDTYGHSLRF